MRFRLQVLISLLLISVVFPSRAYAYIDPMSGSIILQAVAAGLLAALLFFKRFWYRLADAWRRIWHRFVP